VRSEVDSDDVLRMSQTVLSDPWRYDDELCGYLYSTYRTHSMQEARTQKATQKDMF